MRIFGLIRWVFPIAAIGYFSFSTMDVGLPEWIVPRKPYSDPEINTSTRMPDSKPGHANLSGQDEGVYKLQSDGNQVTTDNVVIDAGNASIHRLYKWRDENNTIVISTETPPGDTRAELLYYSNNADKTAISETDTVDRQPTKESGMEKIADSPLKVYTPGGLKALIRHANKIGEKIELRGKLLDELSEQL